MREYRKHWTVGRVRKTLTARFWCVGNPLRNLLRWLRGEHWSRPFLLGLGRNGTGDCYCDQGTTTDYRFEFFGLGAWAWITRDHTPKPCCCDKVLWLCFPDSHADEIEEYGLDRLQAEFPGVKPVDG